MKIDGATVRTVNETMAGIALTEQRSEELTIELNQFASAMENVAHRVAFDIDPWDFRAALLEVGKGFSQ
jgi:hypothetical protein